MNTHLFCLFFAHFLLFLFHFCYFHLGFCFWSFFCWGTCLGMKDRRFECRRVKKKKELLNCPCSLACSPPPPQPAPPGNVLGPSSYFVCTMHSCRLFIYVNLPFDQSPVTTSYPLAAPVSEGTHLWSRTVCVCVCVHAFGAFVPGQVYHQLIWLNDSLTW